MASGKGVEPIFTDSKSAVLPLDEPERFNYEFEIMNYEFNPKSKWLRQDLNLQLQESNSCALNPLSYEAEKQKREREDSNLQPAPSHGAALIPIALRPQENLRFQILDFGLKK